MRYERSSKDMFPPRVGSRGNRGRGGGVSSLKKFQREANNGNGNKEVATTVWLIVAG